MLSADNTAMILIDVQGKLAQIMHNKDALFANLVKLLKGMQVLDIPIIWVEQNPAGLGPTIPELSELLENNKPIPKIIFNCCGNDDFMDALETLDKKQLIVAGIEAHICVYQTCIDLLSRGHEVEVAADCISSRTKENRDTALQKMRDKGVFLTTVEMALFELLGKAEGETFKALLKIVK